MTTPASPDAHERTAEKYPFVCAVRHVSAFKPGSRFFRVLDLGLDREPLVTQGEFEVRTAPDDQGMMDTLEVDPQSPDADQKVYRRYAPGIVLGASSVFVVPTDYASRLLSESPRE
jgi:hypothetical protein